MGVIYDTYELAERDREKFHNGWYDERERGIVVKNGDDLLRAEKWIEKYRGSYFDTRVASRTVGDWN